MIPKQQRLSTKDINYIIKQGNRQHDAMRTYIRIPQYPNRPYHQISAQLSTKFHKHATIRNSCKRAILDTAQKQLTPHQHRIKLLIIPNKQALPQRHTYLADTTQPVYQIAQYLIANSLSHITSKLCSPTSAHRSKASKPYGKSKETSGPKK